VTIEDGVTVPDARSMPVPLPSLLLAR